MRRGATIPVSVKRDIPGKIAGDLEVVACIQIELDTTRIIQRRKEQGTEIQISLIKFEQAHLGGN